MARAKSWGNVTQQHTATREGGTHDDQYPEGAPLRRHVLLPTFQAADDSFERVQIRGILFGDDSLRRQGR